MAPVRAYSARVQEKTWSLSLDGDDMCLWRSIVGSGFGVGVNRMMPQFFPTLSDCLQVGGTARRVLRNNEIISYVNRVDISVVSGLFGSNMKLQVHYQATKVAHVSKKPGILFLQYPSLSNNEEDNEIIPLVGISFVSDGKKWTVVENDVGLSFVECVSSYESGEIRRNFRIDVVEAALPH